jgi:hypothetical protein
MADCGNYVVGYIQNLKFVSQGLLNIINGNLLQGTTTPAAPINMNPCPTATLPSHVFDCTDWVAIKDLLISASDEPDNTGYLLTLEQTLNCIIQNVTSMSFGLRAQFERFLCLVRSIESRIDSIHCISTCEEVIGDLLCLLVELLTQLISVVSKAATLVYYADCANNPTNCNRSIPAFFECMVCAFVNELCELEKLLPELSAIVMAFIACDMQNCTPCGTATCAPVKTRPICPPKMMHGPKPTPGHGPKPGGCECNKE